MDKTIRVYATGQVDVLQGLLSELPKPFVDLFPVRQEIAVVPMNAEGPEFRSVFAGQSARARTSDRGDIYLDVDKVHGVSSLRALLLHELAHALQFVLRQPLQFTAWTRLGDLAYWDEKLRSLLQLISDKSGLKVAVPHDPIRYQPAARRLMNFFADADVHAFLMDRGVLDLVAYGEALEDYVADLQVSPQRSGSKALHALWLEHKRIPGRPMRIASQSWPVFMEWLTIVGGRWARVGTLVGRRDAAAVLEAYVGPDRDALRQHLGEFADDRVFDERWRELAEAGDDLRLLWKGIERLASDAVVLVRSVCDRS